MSRSTEQPDEIEIKRKKITNEGLKVDLLIHWDINEIQVEDDISGESHTEWEYEEEKITITYDGDRSQIEQYLQKHNKELLLKAKVKSDQLEESDKDNLSYPTFKADSTYKGKITEIDGANQRVKVEKTVGGKTVSAWCHADYTLLLAYQNDDLAVGDIVIVSFVDEDLDLPYAHGLPLGV